MKCIELHCDFYCLNKEKQIMTIGKSNRCNEYMKEIEHIKYEYLQKNEFFCTPLQRRFYEHRVQLLETYIQNYLNTTNEQEHK